MSLWLILTPSDLDDYLAAPQVAALRAAALGSGQTDPFLRVMPDVASRIRAEIQGCPRNRVSATPQSIPPNLKSIACLLILEALQARIPGLSLTPEQKTLIADGRDYLKRIGRGQAPVEAPDDPEPSAIQPSSGLQRVAALCPRTGRAHLDGL